MTTGTCLCGKVKFKIDCEITDASLCYCSICRKATGSAFGAYGCIPSKNLKWVQSKNHLSEFKATKVLEKIFCSNCGSTLATRHQSWPDYIYISLGCLDGDSKINLEYHQFVASKANWVTICDGIKQYDEWPENDE